jgi:Competence protein
LLPKLKNGKQIPSKHLPWFKKCFGWHISELALFPALTSGFPIKKWAAVAILAAAAFYLLLSGAEVATQRSFFMTAVFLNISKIKYLYVFRTSVIASIVHVFGLFRCSKRSFWRLAIFLSDPHRNIAVGRGVRDVLQINAGIGCLADGATPRIHDEAVGAWPLSMAIIAVVSEREYRGAPHWDKQLGQGDPLAYGSAVAKVLIAAFALSMFLAGGSAQAASLATWGQNTAIAQIHKADPGLVPRRPKPREWTCRGTDRTLTMILSDIDVHREQTGGAARYFGVDDAEILADHLSDSLQGAKQVVARDLLPDIDDRVGAFAAEFVSVIRRTAQLSSR